MPSNEEKNELLVMVLIDLGELCKKLGQSSVVPDRQREEFRQLGEEYDSLLPYRGKGTPVLHAKGESLLFRITRFLPNVLDVDARPMAANE